MAEAAGLDVSAVAEWLKGWVLPLFGPGAFFGFVWAGRKLQVVDTALETLQEHTDEIKEMKNKQVATDLKVEALPTRNEVTNIVQSAVSQIGQMIAGFAYHNKESSFDMIQKLLDRLPVPPPAPAE